jgi:hypothetical protein
VIGVPGHRRRGAVARPVVDNVVVGAKCVQLQLEVGRRVCRRLLGQELLEGLVEALDLAAGLGMVGRGVLVLDAESVQSATSGWVAQPGSG